MYRKFPSIYSKIKASVLLLCLGLMVLGACPIQKLLLNAASVEVETFAQASATKMLSDSRLDCSYSKEIVKTPLIELTKKSNNNTLYFVLLSTLASLFTSFVANRSIPFAKRENSLGSPVPLFLRNQVFII